MIISVCSKGWYCYYSLYEECKILHYQWFRNKSLEHHISHTHTHTQCLNGLNLFRFLHTIRKVELNVNFPYPGQTLNCQRDFNEPDECETRSITPAALPIRLVHFIAVFELRFCILSFQLSGLAFYVFFLIRKWNLSFLRVYKSKR